MELGPIQKAWIASLREHPERQRKNLLGEKKEDGSYQACCLGELLLVEARMKSQEEPFDKSGYIKCGGSESVLSGADERLGLRSSIGRFMAYETCTINGIEFNSLAQANDEGVTWPQIADFIEQFPDKVFKESV